MDNPKKVIHFYLMRHPIVKRCLLDSTKDFLESYPLSTIKGPP
ncbi:hypothetical protein SAMN04488109_5710 [Chryseolinea serpens]|uniref:Uncharacterized protein n=1 Tax=Chryseolinea serpens TaxID=947013 RepID=A0A1M5WHN1_9BACT|nr:hypothetical protein SAMN04488109_5710 [Chryseolinea serpens]